MAKYDQPLNRRDALRTFSASVLSTGLMGRVATIQAQQSTPPQVLGPGESSPDARLLGLTNLNDYFPFHPPSSVEEWEERAQEVRRRILVAAGLWPMPPKVELKPVIHGAVDREEYTVFKVFFESFPGLYVTGNLYKPKGSLGSLRPGVLSPHGHWTDGRFHAYDDDRLLDELESGAERFENGGRHPIQSRCVQLVRMGCIVFHYDMLGYADSVPISYQLAHRFERQRPDLQDPDRWGIFSAQAELRLQNILGLQLYNSIRALDFIESQPDVDANRIAVTGQSGGGTQTFLLSAVDERVAAAFPAVMVSTAMQGGCTCENASYLRIGTGNVEFAGLTAPRPLGLTGANDWTVEIETKGLPELKKLYNLLGHPENVRGQYFNFGHNFNYPSRSYMYEFMNTHLQLGVESPIREQDYRPLSITEMSVWNEEYPKPPSNEAAEVSLLKALDAASNEQLATLRPTDRASLKVYEETVRGAIKTMVGRRFPNPSDLVYEKTNEIDQDGYNETAALIRYTPEAEAVPTIFLYPADWNGHVVLWVTGTGKSELFEADGSPLRPVQRLLQQGVCVATFDLLGQGEATTSDGPLTISPKVENPREFLGYTTGYNHPIFASRVHDILTLFTFVKNYELEKPSRVDLVATSGAGRWGAAAGAIIRQELGAIALSTDGFRFKTITDIRDLDLWPGALKYGDLPALLSLCAPIPLWLTGEGERSPSIVSDCYRSVDAHEPTCSTVASTEEANEIVRWLLTL